MASQESSPDPFLFGPPAANAQVIGEQPKTTASLARLPERGQERIYDLVKNLRPFSRRFLGPADSGMPRMELKGFHRAWGSAVISPIPSVAA
jgi:hypothetical protein